MKKILGIVGFSLMMSVANGCATSGQISVADTPELKGEIREVKLVWDHASMPEKGKLSTLIFERPKDDLHVPEKYVVYYGEKSRYDWWDERCNDADIVFLQIKEAQSKGLKIKFSEEEWRLIRDCPDPYPYRVDAGTATQVVLKLPKGKKFYAAIRSWENSLPSRYTEEVEISAQ